MHVQSRHRLLDVEDLQRSPVNGDLAQVGLLAATFPVLWAAVGGRRSLTSVLIGTIALASLSDALAVYSGELAFVVMGALLLFGMMAAPDGIVITILRFLTRLVGRKSR